MSRSGRRRAIAASGSALPEGRRCPGRPAGSAGGRRRRRGRGRSEPGTRPARPQAGLRHRQGRCRQDHGRRRVGPTGGRARQAGARLRDRRQGRCHRALRGPADRLHAAGDRAGHLVDVHGYRGVAARVPQAAPAHPGRRPHRAAGQGVRLRGDRGTRRARDPDRRQILLGGQGAPLRPRRGRRAGQRARRGAAGGAPGHQRPGEGRPDPRPDRLDARHPLRRAPDRPRGRVHARGDARERDARAGRARARRDHGADVGGGGQPGPARALRPARGGDLRAAARAGHRARGVRRAGSPGGAGARGGPAWR